MKKVKIIISLLFGLSLFTGCNSDKGITNYAKTICSTVSQTAITQNCQISKVEYQSVHDYYTQLTQEWDKILRNNPPAFYQDAIQANKTITTYLQQLPDSGELQIFVISEIEKSATGFYIYTYKDGAQFANNSLITEELITQANNFTALSKTGEYYYIGAKGIVTVAYDVVQEDQTLLKEIGEKINE